MKKTIRMILFILVAILLLCAFYVAYVFLAYHRIGDEPLAVEGEAIPEGPKKRSLKLVSWNIGFGAYEPDFGFFMDGGERSWAWSKERLEKNMENICALLKGEEAQIYLLQEVDVDSTRTYYLDERKPLIDALGPERQYVYAPNNDSPFLMYPFHQPHGFMRTGILTFSSYPIRSALRKELPVEKDFHKILDLDRCYEKLLLDLPEGKTLSLYNIHCSAYTSDGSIAEEQIHMLLRDMQSEYESGAWCIAGGDFNKDLLGDSSQYFGTTQELKSWTRPLPEDLLASYNVSLSAPLYGPDQKTPVPSVRNADAPYHEGQLVLTVDGFLVTDNVRVDSLQVIDTEFAYSDHNPIQMEVTLLPSALKEEVDHQADNHTE